MMRTRWTAEQVEDFRAGHESLILLLYTGAVLLELRRAREKWLRGVAPK